MSMSPTVRAFTSEHYAVDPDRAVMVNLARLITAYYHALVTGEVLPQEIRMTGAAYNAYMILAMCREMSQGEGSDALHRQHP